MSKLKRILIIMVSVLLIGGAITTIALTAQADPQFTVSSHEINYDAATDAREIEVKVSMPQDTNVFFCGLRVKISFDPTVMTIKETSGLLNVNWNFGQISPFLSFVSVSDYNLVLVNEHLAELTTLMVSKNSQNLDYTKTFDGVGNFLSVIFTIKGDAPAGVHQIGLSFPTDSSTNPDYPYNGNAIKMVDGVPENFAVDLVNGKLTINPIPITYTASITGLTGGEAVYGTTLGASAVGIKDTRDNSDVTEAEVDHFTYQWYRDGVAIENATGVTYSPTAADILASDADIEDSGDGCILSVTIGASGNFTATPASSSEVKAVRAAYTGTVPVPVLVSRTINSITVGISDPTLQTSECQFRKGLLAWQPNGTFTDLDNSNSYNFSAQVAQTATTYASAASDNSVGIKPQIPISGTLAVSDTTPVYGQTLTANTDALDADFVAHGLSKATYAWYWDSIAPTNIKSTASSYTVGQSDIGHTLILGIKAVDDFTDPEWGFTSEVYSDATSAVERAENTATPTTPTVAENTYVNTDGLTINIAAGQEYRIKQGTTTVSDWTPYAGPTQQFTTDTATWLKPATDYVIETRFAATTTTNAGTEIASKAVTSEKWLLTTSSLSTSPTDNWKYNIEITATGSTSPTEANASLIYQWYRGTDAIVGANTNKYTPVAADVDQTLKVTLTVGGSYEWAASLNKEVSGVVGRAAGPDAPAQPEVVSYSAFTIKILTVAGYQYQINTSNQVNSANWGAVEDNGEYEFTGRSPNTTYYIFARIAQTATQEASAPSFATQVTTNKAEVGGTVSISVSGGGDAEWGKTLTANTASVTPAPAVQYLVYNWYSGTDLVQSGSESSYVTVETDFGKDIYLDLNVIEDCDYKVYTTLKSSSVTVLAQTIGGTASISGLAADGAEWGKTLTAVITGVTPSEAQTGILYNWYIELDKLVDRSVLNDAPTYTPFSSDVGKTLTLTLGGSGSYRGTVTTTTTIRKQTITEKPTVSGSPTFGKTIGASLEAIPTDAQTDIGYQWYRSTTETGTGTAITGATGSTYVITGDDIGKWLYVAVTVDAANATYRGTTRSTAVEGGKEIITASIGITGTAKFDQELTITISSLTPSAATYDVIWYRDGSQIKRGDGAILANTKYTLVQADIGTVISATIIGTGNYTGTPTAAETTEVTKADGPAKPAARPLFPTPTTRSPSPALPDTLINSTAEAGARPEPRTARLTSRVLARIPLTRFTATSPRPLHTLPPSPAMLRR